MGINSCLSVVVLVKCFQNMHKDTGVIKELSEVQSLSLEEQSRFIEIKRDLTVLEKANRQIKMYSPCGCGSGKKFKFCCYKK